MACLAYNPSSITIDTKDYRREELLGITTNLLQKIKKNFVAVEGILNPAINESQVSLDKNPESDLEDHKIGFGNE